MPVKEARSEETPYGRYVTSDGWFVLNLTEALAVRNDEQGGALYPLEARAAPFGDFGVNVRILAPGQPTAMYHAESGQEGFLVLAGECTLVVEEEERTLRQWDYFHCPPETRHVFVGDDEPCVVLMIGLRPEEETLYYPVSEVAAKYGASVAQETYEPEEAYAAWPGDYEPVRIEWPLPRSGP
jgi:uncharacterized cupin superfamily protein